MSFKLSIYLCVLVFSLSNVICEEVQVLEFTDTKVYNTLFRSDRQKRETEFSGDEGCFNYCPAVVTVDCDENDNCVCADGYYSDVSGNTCKKGLEFGGQMTFTNDYDNEENKTKEIEAIIESIYMYTSGYISSKVLSLSNGSINAIYQITATDNANFTDFESALKNELDSCVDNGTKVMNGYILDCNKTEESGLDARFLCEDSCDSETTDCIANQTVTCSCKNSKDTIYMYSVDSRTMFKCFDDKDTIDGFCASGEDCRQPFGWCHNETSTCSCMWGFSGTYCEDAWLFIFTCTASGCVLIIILLLIWVCCLNRTVKKLHKESKLNGMDYNNPFEDFQPSIMRAKVPNLYINDYLDDGGNTNSMQSGHANGSFEPDDKDKSNGYKTEVLQNGGNNSDPREYF